MQFPSRGLGAPQHSDGQPVELDAGMQHEQDPAQGLPVRHSRLARH